MMKGIGESSALTKHISCECRCKIDDTKCDSKQKWNINKYHCECKKDQ